MIYFLEIGLSSFIFFGEHSPFFLLFETLFFLLLIISEAKEIYGPAVGYMPNMLQYSTSVNDVDNSCRETKIPIDLPPIKLIEPSMKKIIKKKKKNILDNIFRFWWSYIVDKSH